MARHDFNLRQRFFLLSMLRLKITLYGTLRHLNLYPRAVKSDSMINVAPVGLRTRYKVIIALSICQSQKTSRLFIPETAQD